ncbi:Reticulon-3 [Papilio machaon]|uniref:Reticulon-like protein n=1 Tax=Papilio machaon TaxID=76193 RepID=A0A0N1IP33_PAPMA|nr:Reticulon-3 [Papilio machaon]
MSASAQPTADENNSCQTILAEAREAARGQSERKPAAWPPRARGLRAGAGSDDGALSAAHSAAMARPRQSPRHAAQYTDLPPRGPVEALIYWRCAARSGAALGGGLALLVALASCSVVSVLAYAALLALAAALSLRIYRNVLQAVQKTNDGHPFKWLLEKDISLPAERAQELAAAGTAHLNAAVHELRRVRAAVPLGRKADTDKDK